MNEEGKIKDERKVYHSDLRHLQKYFSSFRKGTGVSIEATRNWYWFVDFLEDLGLEAKLVHAKKARVIAESTIKTDKVDARTLAHLDRCNFLPQAYIADKKTRSRRELLRYYMGLVKIRTSIKNRVHAILAKNNIQHGFSDLFGKAGLEFLKGLDLTRIFRLELNGYLEVLEEIKDKINETKRAIKKECNLSEHAKRLTTIPGISFFSALLLASEIADINRFKTYKRLCCYAGLVSTTRQTSDTTIQGHIIKDSNKYIRYALIEAVPIAVKNDPKLWLLYNKLLRKKGRQKAKIAVARKLLVTIYFMLRDNTDYIKNNKIGFSQVNPVAKLGA
jgi:transposase